MILATNGDIADELILTHYRALCHVLLEVDVQRAVEVYLFFPHAPALRATRP